MYLFIYLFGSLPAPSFHSCRHSFLSFSSDLGTFVGGRGYNICSVLRVKGLRQAGQLLQLPAALGPLRPAYQSGVGSVGDGGCG